MHTRIKEIRTSAKLTQQEFADRLGIRRGTIANYELGRNEPIDAVITLICREFNVSELWLRTGKGDMFKPVSRDQEIKAFLNELMKAEKPDFRKRMVTVLARLDVKEWQVLEEIARKLVDASSEGKTGLQVIKIAGRDGSYEEHTLTGDEVIELENQIDQLKKPPEDI
jgi:transcriptional regulator with XRE-family HTH domain